MGIHSCLGLAPWQGGTTEKVHEFEFSKVASRSHSQDEMKGGLFCTEGFCGVCPAVGLPHRCSA